ncbi:MAG: hypothetical protein JJ863_34625 [Deltaproteobacteria bacterium]|nr:hypothetical protein [Deltaproteobacteria bacterium]
MDRDRFARRFAEAAISARDFARTFIEEPLPDAMRFRVRLNSSYDGTASDDFRLYPGDSSAEIARRLANATEEEVVATLWRHGRVPQWVNLSTIGLTARETLVEVMACGRFTANEGVLYHRPEGRPPFHVLGPALPPGHSEGEKFSIYNVGDCWTGEELQRHAANSSKVWALTLRGPRFDDETVGALHPFTKMRILEIHDSILRGPGLVGLANQPSLRHFRLHLASRTRFSAGDLPLLPDLETFTLTGLPGGEWGFVALAERAAGLQWLSLQSRRELDLGAELQCSPRSISLTGTRVVGTPLPRKLDALSLRLSAGSDSEIEALLEKVDSLNRLGLSGSPIGGALASRLASRWPLTSLDLTETNVTDDEIREIADRHPGTKVFPRGHVPD